MLTMIDFTDCFGTWGGCKRRCSQTQEGPPFFLGMAKSDIRDQYVWGRSNMRPLGLGSFGNMNLAIGAKLTKLPNKGNPFKGKIRQQGQYPQYSK